MTSSPETGFRKSAALSKVQPSATIAITQLARELRAAGRDVISLSIGEPDFDTPEHVKAAAAEAMAQGKTKYPPVPGVPELRAAISRKFTNENGLAYAPDEVIVSAGAKQVLAFALQATLDPGDEVIIPAPYWVSYPQLATLFGATPVIVETSATLGYKLAPEALAAAITPRSRWLLLNSPGNPSGAVYTRTELAGLAVVLRRHPQVWVLSDEIYEHLVYDDAGFHSFAAVAPDLKDRVLTMNGVSKAYAMTGWRIGYAGGPAELIKAMSLLQGQITGGAATISQWAAVAALTGPQADLSDRRRAFDRRRHLVVDALNAIDGITCPLPGGAFYAYPGCGAFLGRTTVKGRLIESDEEFCLALLEEAGVATVHGSAFGLGPAFRVSYAASGDTLRRACDRIAAFCAQLA